MVGSSWKWKFAVGNGGPCLALALTDHNLETIVEGCPAGMFRPMTEAFRPPVGAFIKRATIENPLPRNTNTLWNGNEIHWIRQSLLETRLFVYRSGECPKIRNFLPQNNRIIHAKNTSERMQKPCQGWPAKYLPKKEPLREYGTRRKYDETTNNEVDWA